MQLSFFLQKDLITVTMRDIAEAADINLALINYHFKSKDLLIAEVASNLFSKFSTEMEAIIVKKENLEKKIAEYISKGMNTLIAEPNLIYFFVCLVRYYPKVLINSSIAKSLYNLNPLYKQINEYRKLKKMQSIKPNPMLMNIISMMAFPFLISPLIMDKNEIPKSKLKLLMNDRKDIIIQNFLNYIMKYLKTIILLISILIVMIKKKVINLILKILLIY